MITHISIKDFAVIDNMEIGFKDGLSIITGETGSGKSILVTAISLALGSRADSSYVRTGKEKAVIEIMATSDHNPQEEYVISREINNEGRNLCKINGKMSTLGELNEIASGLCDIHGQYDNQSLLNPESHINLVDNYHSDIISPIKLKYKNLYDEYISISRKYNSLVNTESDNLKKVDFYRFQLEEIDAASISPGEDEDIQSKLSLLQNSEKIFNSAKDAYESIEGSASASIGSSLSNLEHISQYSSDISKLRERIEIIYYEIEDISSNLREIIESLTYDPDEIDSAIFRLNLLDDLKKKYSGGSGDLSEVLAYRDKISEELNTIENFDEEKGRLSESLKIAEESLLSQGKLLTAAREKSAEELENKILQELKELNFEESKIKFSFAPTNSPTENGMETAELMISLNKGEPLKPLAKTSSGGELSRIMLAIKTISSEYDNIPTIIFDEIDQGISGKTAAIVGKKLKDISKKRQVLCITHLPQIAAISDVSYKIYKESDDKSTYTHMNLLSQDEKVMEIARLLGGEDISPAAVKNAQELIQNLSK